MLFQGALACKREHHFLSAPVRFARQHNFILCVEQKRTGGSVAWCWPLCNSASRRRETMCLSSPCRHSPDCVSVRVSTVLHGEIPFVYGVRGCRNPIQTVVHSM